MLYNKFIYIIYFSQIDTQSQLCERNYRFTIFFFNFFLLENLI